MHSRIVAALAPVDMVIRVHWCFRTKLATKDLDRTV
jgi:hypothetical protein